ncbi:Nucleotidyl transferase [Desulfarculus baarsii DSM 2075]|uniref:mannose-1-phosphate guanylyltransferase n=1 Tax=Desulfarculus baarsii (strain ATCC 33931 / DSM 2075 / LMG 7858 / VKM B-1802 / 2st14) TaxID=644282 RepID=E1QKF9_DESB2|nr:mannose-1-phosphate guanylyltransferase [Desulfarculus baarsii]ADK86052.1 Nucleotidyl transferase [Desulfarculus baarsii DSM 2075]
MKLYAVVMAGGSGTRFWPASRQRRPKQLLALTGGRSLLQQTIDRVAPLIPAERVLVVTGAGHAAEVAAQLPHLAPGQILAEPLARNTAAAAAVGALWVAGQDQDGVCVVLPADHLITDESLFLQTLAKAGQVAHAQGQLVTLGLTPRYPATGFGYIEAGALVDGQAPQVSQVAAFHEKPALAKAEEYLHSGRHFWNSGMFAWSAGVFLAEVERLLPELAQGLARLAPHLAGDGRDEWLARIYPALPSISVDYGVLEKTSRLRVVRADFGWSDVGSWEAMGELWPADAAGNVCQDGRILAIESSGNVVAAGGRLGALLGVNDLVAVVTDDVLMIVPRDRCQDVRQIIDQLRAAGLDEHL